MPQLSEGRIPLSPLETRRLEELLVEHGDHVISMTRRDPGNRGPVIVSFADGTELELALQEGD